MTMAVAEEKPKANPAKFEDLYVLSKRLQSGSYGTVYVTTNKATKKDYAVKVMDRLKFKKPEKDTRNVYREVRIMKELTDCEGIIRLEDFFEQPNTFHVVLELAQGGDLFDRLGKRTTYTEKDARDLAFSLLQTIKYMHERDIVHRDLKPENLLLRDLVDDTAIKLGDFGFAKKLPVDGSLLRTRCGTPAFVAPEILLGSPYGKSVDCWSVGVILYMLLGGYAPFQDKHHRELFQKIRSADFTFHEKYWKTVSVEAKRLITRLLTVNAHYRCTVESALESGWITKLDGEELSARDLSGSIKMLASFEHPSPQQKLKGAFHAVNWARNAQFWDSDAVTFSGGPNKFEALFSDEERASKKSFTKILPSRSNKQSSLKAGVSLKISSEFKDVYDLVKKVRKGSMATVWECVHRQSKKVYAVKIIKREGLTPHDDEDVMNEVSVLQSLKHDHIVQLIDFYEAPDYFYMVMEYMEGGDVFDRVVERKNYTEKDARDLIQTLLETIAFIHSHGVAHRDLKPQNILLKSNDDDADIKLADFGFAKRVHMSQSLTTRCGTPTYVAPEILKNVPHDQAVDMWSIGVIAYVLLSGYPPFASDNQAELFRQIRTGTFEFHDNEWSEISPDAKELIRGLLVVDPFERLTAEQALNNKWFDRDDELLSSNELSDSVREIKEIRKKFKGLSGAMRWLSIKSSAKPVKVEKLCPIPDNDPNAVLSNDRLV